HRLRAPPSSDEHLTFITRWIPPYTYHFFFFRIPPPPRSTLFPYTTLFRSGNRVAGNRHAIHCRRQVREVRQADGAETIVRPHFSDRKSTRLNSSHLGISYAVFCLKKKKHRAHSEQRAGTQRHRRRGGTSPH